MKPMTPVTKGLLKAVFGVPPVTPPPVAPAIATVKPEPKPTKSIGDMKIAVEAQKIYNPQAPVEPKPAPAKEADKGVGPALSVGGPEAK